MEQSCFSRNRTGTIMYSAYVRQVDSGFREFTQTGESILPGSLMSGYANDWFYPIAVQYVIVSGRSPAG